MRPRLVTIPFSHYCEKARWALDRAGVEYVEEPHLPMFPHPDHRGAWAPALRAGKRRTVPVLVTDEEVVTDSHDILRWVDRRTPALGLYPKDIAADVEELEAVFDRKVAPATRRLAYHVILTSRRVTEDLFAHESPRWEASAAGALFPLMRRMMKRGLKIDDARRCAAVVREGALRQRPRRIRRRPRPHRALSRDACGQVRARRLRGGAGDQDLELTLR